MSRSGHWLTDSQQCPQHCAGHWAAAARSPVCEETLGSAGGYTAVRKVSHYCCCYCCSPSCVLYLTVPNTLSWFNCYSLSILQCGAANFNKEKGKLMSASHLVARWERAPHFQEIHPSLCHALGLFLCPDPALALFHDPSPGLVRAPSLFPALCLFPGPSPSLCHAHGLFHAHGQMMCWASCLCVKTQLERSGEKRKNNGLFQKETEKNIANELQNWTELYLVRWER